MGNDGFLIGIVFCKSLMAVGSAGHRYGGTRGASKTCRASNTSDHDSDAVASDTMDIDSCSCLSPLMREGMSEPFAAFLEGGMPLYYPIAPDISNSDPCMPPSLDQAPPTDGPWHPAHCLHLLCPYLAQMHGRIRTLSATAPFDPLCC